MPCFQSIQLRLKFESLVLQILDFGVQCGNPRMRTRIDDSEEATRLWKRGFTEALRALEPSLVLFYGKPVPGYVPPVECIHYDNETVTRLKQINERKEP